MYFLLSSDGIVRIFTAADDRVASKEELQVCAGSKWVILIG